MTPKEAVRFCESIECSNCPIFKFDLDKRSEEECKYGIYCCENLEPYTIQDLINMGEKVLTLNIEQWEEDYFITGQKINQKVEKKNGYTQDICFNVWNLWDCPEDAIIGRDLFTAGDFIDALNLGIKLASLGVDKVEGNYITHKKGEEE